jgi:type IV pilus assembly protein PilO
VLLLGVYIPLSPVAQERDAVDKAVQQRSTLNTEVQQLQVYRQRYGELKQQMDALSKQLDTLKTIVPEEKEVDEFMRLLQEAAAASGVQIRSLNSEAVVPRDYHYELPFSITVDGPYFSIEDFFARLSRLSRIINVGDLSFTGLPDPTKAKYPARPGTTVTGRCTVTTFFSKPLDQSPAPAGKKPAGGNPPGR